MDGFEKMVDTCVLPCSSTELTAHAHQSLLNTRLELQKCLNSLLSCLVLVPAAPYPPLEAIRKTGWPHIPTSEQLLSLFPSASNASK